MMGLGVQQVLDQLNDPDGLFDSEEAMGLSMVQKRPIRGWALGPICFGMRDCLREDRLCYELGSGLPA